MLQTTIKLGMHPFRRMLNSLNNFHFYTIKVVMVVLIWMILKTTFMASVKLFIAHLFIKSVTWVL